MAQKYQELCSRDRSSKTENSIRNQISWVRSSHWSWYIICWRLWSSWIEKTTRRLGQPDAGAFVATELGCCLSKSRLVQKWSPSLLTGVWNSFNGNIIPFLSERWCLYLGSSRGGRGWLTARHRKLAVCGGWGRGRCWYRVDRQEDSRPMVPASLTNGAPKPLAWHVPLCWFWF